MCSTLWEKAEKALESIPNPKDQLFSFAEKVTTIDEKISEYLVPQVEEVSDAARSFFQRIRATEDEKWAEEAEEKVNLTAKAVSELNSCTQKVKELLDTFKSKTNMNWTRPQTSSTWRTKYTKTDNPPPDQSEPKEAWYDWLTRRLTHILEFLKEEIMPPMMVYTALPASLVVIVVTLCPPLAHAAPGVMGAFCAAVLSVFSLNKVLPALIEMLKNAQSGGGSSVSRSSIDRIKDFMSSLQQDGDGN
ncbi:uncharacterized protein LOC135934113 [Cloeon dipterum]|uniref:uncharacterized protein LOC135934113 n=1 Tax=Cloeon dipterum TaxID=197152 RepID=UPI00321FFEFB